jgi:hypothetical protein
MMMDQVGKQVVLLEDNQEHFNKISDVLSNCGYTIKWDFKNAKKMMADFEAYKTCSKNFIEIHRETIREKISSIENDNLIWIIDINWTGNSSDNNADEYGLDFIREFQIIDKAIILSVNPKEKYRSALQGSKYVSKFDESGNLFTKTFENKLLNALAINPIKNDSPWPEKLA